MKASQSLLVVFTVYGDVERMLGTEFFHHILDVLHALSSLTHRLGGEVSVAARTIPIWEELGGEGHIHVEVLSDTAEQVTRHPEVVANLDTSAGADLVLPLARHDFSIGSADVDTSIEAGLVVSVSNNTSEADVGTDGAVVGTLFTGVSVGGPAEGPGSELVLGANQSVFLLDTVPGLLLETLVPNLSCKVSEVGVAGHEDLASAVLPVEGLAKDEDVVTFSEGVIEVGDGLEDDFGVLSHGLVSGRTIIVPLRDVSK